MLAFQRILDVGPLMEMMTLPGIKLMVNRDQWRILVDLVQEVLGHLNGDDTVIFTVQHLRKAKA